MGEMDKTEWTKAMDVYSFEPSIYEVWDDLQEWYYANVIHAAYLNATTAETSQRMNAMEVRRRMPARCLVKSLSNTTVCGRQRSPPSSARSSVEPRPSRLAWVDICALGFSKYVS